MAMLVGELGANYFITVFEHLAALRKRKKKKDPLALQFLYVRMPGSWLWAQKDECLSFHMAAPPESGGIMSECSLFLSGNSVPSVSELVNFAFFIRRHVLSASLGMYPWLCVFVCVDNELRVGHWLGRSMANITALEKCFCSQAAWQKWQSKHRCICHK